MRFHHVGFPITKTADTDILARHLCPPSIPGEDNPYGIKWMPGGHKAEDPDILNKIACVAFEVADVEVAVIGKNVLLQPSIAEGGTVCAFVETDGAPIQLLNLDKCKKQPHPVATRFKYHSFWIPTKDERPGDIYLPALKMHVNDPKNEYHVGWVRYDEDAPYPDVVKNIPHIAFEVDNIKRELKDEKIIIKPNSPAPGLIVAFIVFEGIPVEFLQIDRNLIDI